MAGRLLAICTDFAITHHMKKRETLAFLGGSRFFMRVTIQAFDLVSSLVRFLHYDMVKRFQTNGWIQKGWSDANKILTIHFRFV